MCEQAKQRRPPDCSGRRSWERGLTRWQKEHQVGKKDWTQTIKNNGFPSLTLKVSRLGCSTLHLTAWALKVQGLAWLPLESESGLWLGCG